MKTVTIPALGHDFTNFKTTKSSTCTEAGSMERKCKRCDKVEKSTISPIGHDFTDFITTKQPTCTETGLRERKCKRCDKVEKITIPALSNAGHNAGETPIVIKQPTCISAGEKVIKCKTCNAVLNTITIPKRGHKYAYDPKTLSVKCSVCGIPYVATSSTTWKYYVEKCGIDYSSLSKSDKEEFTKNFLIAKGCDRDFINMSFEMANNNKTVTVESYDKLKSCITHINLFSDKAGYEFTANLTAYLGYGATAVDAYAFLNSPNGSYANIDQSLNSFITVSSDLVGLIPDVGYSYSKLLDGLVEPLNNMIKVVKKENDRNIEALLREDEIINYYEDYTALADPAVYEAAVKYIDEIEMHDYNYAKDLVDHYIYSSMANDVKDATGMSLEEIRKMVK